VHVRACTLCCGNIVCKKSFVALNIMLLYFPLESDDNLQKYVFNKRRIIT